MAEPHMSAEPVADEGTLERQPARPKLPLRVDARRQYTVADFPGCRAVRISRDEIDSWEGRLEFWDARTEIAMVAEPATTYHEYPSQRLIHLTAIIAQCRGSPIITVGTAALLLRTDTGAKAQIMQADQTVYLHPNRDRPRGAAMEVGQKLPDVVLEVDHTTDVYRRKFDLYEEWGFPELWVEVPDAASRSRPKRKVPGLRIHVLSASGRFEERAASAAFAGWTAPEIHRALNEETPSAETTATLRRIGRALGEREGTGPDDSLFLKAERDEGWREGLAGRIAGRAARSTSCRAARTAPGAGRNAFRRNVRRDPGAAARPMRPRATRPLQRRVAARRNRGRARGDARGTVRHTWRCVFWCLARVKA